MTARVSRELAGVGPRSSQVVLRVRDLRSYLYSRWGIIRAVDGISFDLAAGETLGIVGESGSGKTMLGLSLVRLLPQPVGRTVTGEVVLGGTDLLKLSKREMRRVRGRDISMILQDPHQSLNPYFTVGNQLKESLRVLHPRAGTKQLTDESVAALELVRVPAPERRLANFPHELSGGMKQRIVGAMAMASRPRVLIADEPTTALDLTIQAQYLKLLGDLQEETGVAIILITHDFGVVAATCDRVAVMYAGRIVEHGPVREIFDDPRHPYTKALLASRPRIGNPVDELPSIEGQPPSLVDLPKGCRFQPRCPFAIDVCAERYPPAISMGADRFAHCWRAEEGL